MVVENFFNWYSFTVSSFLSGQNFYIDFDIEVKQS